MLVLDARGLLIYLEIFSSDNTDELVGRSYPSTNSASLLTVQGVCKKSIILRTFSLPCWSICKQDRQLALEQARKRIGIASLVESELIEQFHIPVKIRKASSVAYCHYSMMLSESSLCFSLFLRTNPLLVLA